MLKLLSPLLSVITMLGHAFSRDSDGGTHVTRAELKAIGDEILGIAASASNRVANAPIEVGDTILVRIGGTDEAPRLRPAIVVRVAAECVNVQIFVDGTNDRADLVALLGSSAQVPLCTLWRTSVLAGDGVGEWRRA